MLTWCIGALLAIQGAQPLEAGGIPAGPPPGRYVVDDAQVLDSASQQTIDSIAKARAAIGLPVYMLTIRSVEAYDSTGMTFEAFSRRVFEKWSASRPGGDGAALIIVSVGDKRARIEAGHRWGAQYAAPLAQVIADAIDPVLDHGSLEQGLVLASYEVTWALKPPQVSPWLRDALAAAGVVLAGVLVIGFLRRRRTVSVAEPEPVAPQPMTAVDPSLRVSQRMQAISEARKHSEKAASTITWLDTGEMPRYEGEPPSNASDDDEERGHGGRR